MKAFPYHHAVVADLAWVIKSPSMLNAPLAVFQAAHDGDERLAEWLSVLDSDPLSLKDYLEKNTSSRFLGPYFENLWCFYLEWHPRRPGILRPGRIYRRNDNADLRSSQ